MRAVDQWEQIEADLPAGWREARLSFRPEGAPEDAAAVLLGLRPGRVGDELRVHVRRDLGETALLRNLLRRLDEKRIWGALTLLGADVSERADVSTGTGRSLAEEWDREVSLLPAGWRDLLCELDLDSSALLPRAALLGAPLNPTRVPESSVLRFRASSGGGYGTAAPMVRRCLERMDAEGITGHVRVVHALSDTENVATQGPVWRLAGRSL
ncbi:MAG: hypothetical protein KatS3mg012_1367 [Gaiellaceae bacterium]|jgi:hypothetical protein|nr:MAG: hypothetical protein KatS3mg012_1367 [Gaiellaceae bacterium]